MSNRNYPCPFCKKFNYTSTYLKRHLANFHYCYNCNSQVSNRLLHYCNPIQIGRGRFNPHPFVLKESSLNTFKIYTLHIQPQIILVESLFKTYVQDCVTLLTNVLRFDKNVKVRVIVEAFMHQIQTGDEVMNYLSSKNAILLNRGQINKLLFKSAYEIVVNLNGFVQSGSSWAVIALTELSFRISKFNPFQIGTFLNTPACYYKSKSLFNIPTTTENKCFAYCVMAVLMGFTNKKDAERIWPYECFWDRNYNAETNKFKYIDFSMLSTDGTMDLELISKFEKANIKISVNVFGHCQDEETIYPLKVCKIQRQYHVDLMLLTDEASDRQHFILIHNFDRFMTRKNCDKRFFCKSCLQSFGRNPLLIQHQKNCLKYPCQRMVFPHTKSVNYKLGDKSIKHSAYVVADFETYMQWYQTQFIESQQGIKKTAKHVPLSVGYALVSGGNVDFFKYYDQKDPDKWLIEELLVLADSHLQKVTSLLYPKVNVVNLPS